MQIKKGTYLLAGYWLSTWGKVEGETFHGSLNAANLSFKINEFSMFHI